jgi:hypothetical protein
MAKSPLMFLPETDEEAREANRAYQEALARLTQTLEARKNPTFDPVMMAMASGFAAPTRTGSFFESLGKAAQGAGQAQEAQSAQDVEIAKQQMELAQSGLGMQRMRQKSREIADYLKPKGGTTLTPGGALPGGAPSGGEAPQRGGLQGIQVMEPDPTFISIQEFVARNEGSGKSLGELQAEYQDKFGKNRYITSERGIVDRATGMATPLPGGPNVTRQIIGLPGTYEMDSYTASMLDNYRRQGMMKEYYDLAAKITGQEDIRPREKASGPAGAPTGAPPESLAATKGAPTEKPTEEPTEKPRGRAATRAQGRDAFDAPTAPSSIKSKEELAVEEAAKTEAAKKRAGFQEEARQAALDKSGVSRENIQLADEFLAFANRPDAKEIFGLASQSTLANFVQLLAGGISTPGGPIGMGAIEDFYLNAKLNPQQREAAQRFAQLTVQMQIKMNELVKGAVSNYEQGLFGKASININDLPGTIKLKADALRTRAMFDRDVAEIVRKNPNLNIEQVKDTKEYKLAESRLDERYRNLIIKNANSFQDKTFVDAAKQRKPESLGQSSPSQTPASGSLYDRFKQQQGAF